MRRAIVSCLVVGVALVLVLPASGGETAATRSLTLRFIADFVSGRRFDRPPKNELNRGDRFTIRTELRNEVAQLGKPKGAVVGHDDATYVVTTPPLVSVSLAVTLPGGTLRATARHSLVQGGQNMRVVGGTGRFAGARGTLEARGLPKGRTLNVYRLTLP